MISSSSNNAENVGLLSENNRYVVETDGRPTTDTTEANKTASATNLRDPKGQKDTPPLEPSTHQQEKETHPLSAADNGGISKNRRKKLEKRERAKQKKLERKAAEKARRLEVALSQGRDLAAEQKFVEERTRSGDRRRRLDELWESKREDAVSEHRFEICIDLGGRRGSDNHNTSNTGKTSSNNDATNGANDDSRGHCIRAQFEEAMREREIASLAQQIRYCYSYNKRSPNPVLTAVTGLTLERGSQTTGDDATVSGWSYPTVRELLEREIGFPEWNRRMFDCTERTLEDYYGLASATTDDDTVSLEICSEEHAPQSPVVSSPSRQQKQQPRKIVYLTSDSPTTLEHLEDGTVYVIGGIVDRNRLKRFAIDRAETELHSETAKLPLQEYLSANNISMATTKVLTVNHVFDILLKYRQHGNDWNQAFRDVLPSRKV